MKKNLIITISGWFLLFVISLLIQPVSFDEGLAFLGAKNVLNGNLPYKDFWTIYAPGQFYLNSIIMFVFGESIFALRIFSGLIIFFVGIIANKNLEFLTKKEQILPGIVVFFLLFSVNFFGRAIISSMLLIMILIYIIQKYQAEENNKYLVYGGLINTLILIFRQDFGAYIAIVIFLYLVITPIVNKEELKVNTIVKSILIYHLTFVISSLPVALHFIYYSGLDNVYNQLYHLPSSIFPEYRKISFNIFDLKENAGIFEKLSSFYLTIIGSTIIGVGASGFSSFKKYYKSIKSSSILLYLISYILILQFAIRSDLEHSIPMVIIFSLSLFLDFFKSEFQYRGYIPKFMIFLMFILILSLPTLNFARVAKEIKTNTFEMVYGSALKYTPINSSANNDLKIISQKLDFATKPDEKIFVCNFINDKIYINDVMIYIYSGKMPASNVYELHPGYATHQAGQTEIIDDLINTRNRILIEVDYPIVEEGNLSSKSSGVFLLDDFVKNNYFEFYSKGKYKLFIRRN